MSIKYSDSGFLDGADETKKLSFDVSGVTTGTTRTITMPDANVDLSSVGTPDDNSVTLAKMAGGTDGNLITYDASGDPAYVTTGTSGQVLTSGGAGVAPTFQAAAGGGKLLQVIIGEDSTQNIISTSSYTDIGLSASITPSSTSSKILIQWNATAQIHSAEGFSVQLLRDSTDIYQSGATRSVSYHTAETVLRAGGYITLDSPNTTSSITYTAKVASYNSHTLETNNGGEKTQILLMEIGA